MDYVEQEKFIESLKIDRDYWLSLPNKSPKEIVDGVLFSLLVMIDGDSGTNDFHALKIVDTVTGKRIDCGYLHELYFADERERDLGKGTLEGQKLSPPSSSRYNKIVKCNLEDKGIKFDRDIFLLTGDGIEVDEGFEVDLTGMFCFNTEFKSLKRETVAVVNSVAELLAFCDKHNISVPSTCLEYEGCLSVGACCDYVLNNALEVLGWAEELPENMLRKISLDEQMNRAAAPPAAKLKPDCPLIGQDGNIFNLMSIASRTLKENDLAEQATEMCDRIQRSGSYDEALCILGEYVNITSTDKRLDDRGER